jgi:hypothetical protein
MNLHTDEPGLQITSKVTNSSLAMSFEQISNSSRNMSSGLLVGVIASVNSSKKKLEWIHFAACW